MMNMSAAHSKLYRFLTAQEGDYEKALGEIKNGRKQSHWMWYIFPQIKGLGMTDMSRRYAITDIDEASEYLKHPVLSLRLINICGALMELKTNNPHEIFGSPDDIKLKSCLTLFDAVPGAPTVFKLALNKYYDGKPDVLTLNILAGK